MQDFWPDSGYATLRRNEFGWLRATPDFFRLLLSRPELTPIDESGPLERALHARLMDDPLSNVDAAALSSIEDDDSRENYTHFLALRKALADAVTLERFYLDAFRAAAVDGAVRLPPLFFDLIARCILRAILDGRDEVYEVRAAEMFFRRQRIAVENGQVLAADAQAIEHFAESGGFGSMGRLMAIQGTPFRGLNLDVLNHETEQRFWRSADRHAWLLDLSHGRPGIAAMARVIALWVHHLTQVEVNVVPVTRIDDAHWRWHIGLDIESSAILNDLYTGNALDGERQARIVALFKLEAADPRTLRADVAGSPVYLAMAVTQDRALKMKPQNLIVNLPVAAHN